MSYIGHGDFILEVVKGNVPGHRIMRGLGERDSIATTASGEDLWRGNELNATPSAPGSHTFIPRPADAGEQMTVISESAADNGGSATGALTIRLSYLDGSGDEQSEDITMNGQTAVDTASSDIRFVQDMDVLTVGANTVAEGNIRIYEKAVDTNVYSMIAAGGNKSLVPHKMVPNGKTLILQEWMAGELSANKRCRVRLRADCTNAVPPVRQASVYLFKSVMALNSSIGQMPLAYKIPALSVVKASAWAETAAAEISVHWWGVLVDD